MSGEIKYPMDFHGGDHPEFVYGSIECSSISPLGSNATSIHDPDQVYAGVQHMDPVISASRYVHEYTAVQQHCSRATDFVQVSTPHTDPHITQDDAHQRFLVPYLQYRGSPDTVRISLNERILYQWMDMCIPDHGCTTLEEFRCWFYKLQYAKSHGFNPQHCALCRKRNFMEGYSTSLTMPPVIRFMWNVAPAGTKGICLFMDPLDWQSAEQRWP